MLYKLNSDKSSVGVPIAVRCRFRLGIITMEIIKKLKRYIDFPISFIFVGP